MALHPCPAVLPCLRAVSRGLVRTSSGRDQHTLAARVRGVIPWDNVSNKVSYYDGVLVDDA